MDTHDTQVSRALAAEGARARARSAALARQLSEMIERSNDAARDDEHDPEGSTVAFERAQLSSLLAAAEAQLADIEVARRRLDEGVHHRCEGCGRSIPRERHLARPAVRTCVRCAG